MSWISVQNVAVGDETTLGTIEHVEFNGASFTIILMDNGYRSALAFSAVAKLDKVGE